MGNCVASVMDRKDRSMTIDHNYYSINHAYGAQGYAIPNTEQENCSAIYRMSHLTDEEHELLKHDYYYGPNTVQMMEEFCARFGDRRALGYRVIERTEKKVVIDALGKEKLFDHYYCSPCKTISYKEMWNKIQTFSRGLSTLGIKPRDVISIYEETRWEWLVTAYAIWMQDMIVSTVYANLGEDALAYALRETESKAIVCNGKSLRSLLKILKMKEIHPILIYLDDIAPDIDLSGFIAIPWQSIMNEGERLPNVKLTMPTDNDAEALIMYTSGTTGDPKGVIHTYGSIVAGIRSFKQRLDEIFRPSEPNDTYCGYLPLAHILEFAIVNLILARGGMIGFGSPRTLTDLNTSPHGDLKEYNPCILIGVPRIYDTIRKGIEAKLPPPGSFKRTVFDRAFESRLQALKEGKDTPYWNDKVFSKVRELLGTKMFGMLSGGGPLSASTQDYLNVVFGGPPIIQGWGLTETISCGTTQRVGDMSTNCAGQIVNAGEVRLLDTDKYKHTDKPEPRGEICLRGPFVFKGYYKQPELTREALDSEGWFHTGDVGSITEDGKIRIIGRIKALAKNALGEYIALEALEAIYNNNHLILPGCICVVVDPSKTYICAIALTDAVRCAAFAKEHNIKGEFPQILGDAKFQEAAAASLVETAKSANRKPFECVKRVRILHDEWTAENGLVTPTSKVRRCNIDTYYKDIIKEMFTEESN